MATTAPSSENASTPAAVKISLPLVGISHPHTRTHAETKEGNGVKAYQQEIFNDIRSEDQLVILARGLGLLRIVTNLLHSYDAAGGNLVLLVGASEQETDWIGEGVCVYCGTHRSAHSFRTSTAGAEFHFQGAQSPRADNHHYRCYER